MRIAFMSLMAGVPWGGSEKLWTKTAALALREGHSVLISLYRWPQLHPEIKALQDEGAQLIFRDRYDSNAGIVKKFRGYVQHRFNFTQGEIKRLERWKPDHVVISQGDTFDLSVFHYPLFEMIKRRKFTFSLICHSHAQYGEIPVPEIYPRAREIFQTAQKIYFVSERMREITERRLCTSLNNASFTWNPVGLDKPGVLPWPRQDKLAFAMVGNLGQHKGHDTLFQVLSGAAWKDREWKLHIYGTGYGEEYLNDLAIFYQIREKIKFWGFVEDQKHIWENNQILLIPSAGEGLPISLVEAMLCGRPAVVSDVGGNAELIREGTSGFIAEAPTVTSFSAALERAYQQKDQWESMGLHAYEYISARIHLQPESLILKNIQVKH